jgi:hypothetical protein
MVEMSDRNMPLLRGKTVAAYAWTLRGIIPSRDT